MIAQCSIQPSGGHERSPRHSSCLGMFTVCPGDHSDPRHRQVMLVSIVSMWRRGSRLSRKDFCGGVELSVGRSGRLLMRQVMENIGGRLSTLQSRAGADRYSWRRQPLFPGGSWQALAWLTFSNLVMTVIAPILSPEN